jgi:hypothetical protein
MIASWLMVCPASGAVKHGSDQRQRCRNSWQSRGRRDPRVACSAGPEAEHRRQPQRPTDEPQRLANEGVIPVIGSHRLSEGRPRAQEQVVQARLPQHERCTGCREHEQPSLIAAAGQPDRENDGDEAGRHGEQIEGEQGLPFTRSNSRRPQSGATESPVPMGHADQSSPHRGEGGSSIRHPRSSNRHGGPALRRRPSGSCHLHGTRG